VKEKPISAGSTFYWPIDFRPAERVQEVGGYRTGYVHKIMIFQNEDTYYMVWWDGYEHAAGPFTTGQLRAIRSVFTGPGRTNRREGDPEKPQKEPESVKAARKRLKWSDEASRVQYRKTSDGRSQTILGRLGGIQGPHEDLEGR
jgi:hypothetical protein